jgi:hypothetical protein
MLLINFPFDYQMLVGLKLSWKCPGPYAPSRIIVVTVLSIIGTEGKERIVIRNPEGILYENALALYMNADLNCSVIIGEK